MAIDLDELIDTGRREVTEEQPSLDDLLKVGQAEVGGEAIGGVPAARLSEFKQAAQGLLFAHRPKVPALGPPMLGYVQLPGEKKIRRPTGEEAQLVKWYLDHFPDEITSGGDEHGRAIIAQSRPRIQQAASYVARGLYGAIDKPTLGLVSKLVPGVKRELEAIPGAEVLPSHATDISAMQDVFGLPGQFALFSGLFRAAGLPAKIVSKTPVATKAAARMTSLLDKTGAKWATPAASIVKRAIGGAAKGVVVGDIVGRTKGWAENLSPEDAAKQTAEYRKWFAIMGAFFEGVAQVDRVRLAGKMKRALSKDFAKARSTVAREFYSGRERNTPEVKQATWTYRKLFAEQNLLEARIDQELTGITRAYKTGEPVTGVSVPKAVARHALQAPGFRNPEAAISRTVDISAAKIGIERLAPKVDVGQLASKAAQRIIKEALMDAATGSMLPGADAILAEQLVAVTLPEVPGQQEQEEIYDEAKAVVRETATGLAQSESASRGDVAKALGVEKNELPPELSSAPKRQAAIEQAKQAVKEAEAPTMQEVTAPIDRLEAPLPYDFSDPYHEVALKRAMQEIQSGTRYPIVVEEEDGVLVVKDGVHRLEAYRRLGANEVPIVMKEAEDAGQARAGVEAEGGQEAVEQAPEGRVRVRDTAEDRVEAEAGEVAPPVDVIAYRGTTEEADRVSNRQALSVTDGGYYGVGRYYTESPDVARVYAEKNRALTPMVRKETVRLARPFVIDWSTPDGAVRTRTEAKSAGVELSGMGMAVEPDKFTTRLQQLGYDGVVVRRANEPTEYVVFSTKQVAPKQPAETPAKQPKPKTKRMQRIEARIAKLEALRDQALTELAKKPAKGGAVAAIDAEIAKLQQASLFAGTAPQAYMEELGAQTPKQLVAHVGKLGKEATPEEAEAVRSIRESYAVQDEIAERYKPEKWGQNLAPVSDYLKRHKIKIAYVRGKHEGAEIKDWLEGRPRAMRQFMKAVKTTAAITHGQGFDVVIAGLVEQHLVPENTDIVELLDTLLAEYNAAKSQPKSWEEVLEREAFEPQGGEEGQYYEMLAEREGGVNENTGAIEDVNRLDAARQARTDATRTLIQARAAKLGAKMSEGIVGAQQGLQAKIKDLRALDAAAANIEGVARQGLEAQAKALDKQIADLKRIKSEDADLQEVRRSIARLCTMKGISKKRFGKIVAKYAEPYRGGRQRRSTHFIQDKATLLKIWAGVERARPKKVGSKAVITARRERNIQSLRVSLTNQGRMTHEDFVRLLQETTRGRAPRYIDAENFITETQAHELIKGMLDEAPLIERRENLRKALAKQPQIKKWVDQDRARAEKVRTALASKGKKARWRSELDLVHQLSYADEATGDDFYESGLAVADASIHRNLAVTRAFDTLESAVGSEQYKAIAKDREAVDRVGLYVASQAPARYNPPPVPEGVSKSERAFGDAVIAQFKQQANQVRFERFEDHWLTKEPIPDAPAAELRKAIDLYESQGPEAARTYLDTCEWGVIHGVYDPWSVAIPKLTVGGQPTWKYGVKQHIEVREGKWEPQEQHILQRLDSYLRQRYSAKYLRPAIRTFIRVWDRNADKFYNSRKIGHRIGTSVSYLAGMPPSASAMGEIALGVYRHSLLNVVLLDPYKWTRNAMQPMVLYTDRTDFLPWRNRKLTPEEQQFYQEHVSQLGGIKRDYAMESGPGWKLIEPVMKFVRNFALYGLSDDLPRNRTFWAKLNRVERAMKKHPKNLQKMLDAAAVDDLTDRQVRGAVERLAVQGPDAFKQAVAKDVTTFVHYAYERGLRSHFEQGEGGIIVGNLLVFPRGTVQRLAFAAKKFATGKTAYARWRGLKTILSVLLGMYVADKLIYEITGKHAYTWPQVFAWKAGGLLMGTLEAVGEVQYDMFRALQGEPGALDATVVGINRLKDYLIPWHAQLMNVLEGVTRTRNLDMYAYRKLKAALDENYKPLSPTVRRTVGETFQKILFGGADRPLSDIAELAAVNYAREHGIEVRDVPGTLRGGRIGVEDVKKYERQ